MSFLSQPRTVKIKNTYINGFLDCSGDIILRSGNVIIGNISQPGYNANQRSLMVNGRTEMNGNLIVNGNLLVSSNNIALGLKAGNITNGIQDGVPNGLNTTAVGSFSGMNHTGQNNTFIGSVAGQTTSTTYFSRTGSNNTYLGYRTSSNNSAWGNSTAVGTGSVISASNQIVLGTAEESVSIAGNVNTGGFSTFTLDSSFSGNILLTQLNNPLWFVSRNASTINSTLSTNGSDVGIFYGTTNPAAAGLVISPRGIGSGIKMSTNGNVGIGTATPDVRLELTGSALNGTVDQARVESIFYISRQPTLSVQNSTSFGIKQGSFDTNISSRAKTVLAISGSPLASNNYGRIPDISAIIMQINNSGDLQVGIGVSTPTVTLDVAGAIKATGAITGATATNTINGVIINNGAVSNVTSLGLNGAITGATTTNTINNVIINAGAVSGVTTLSLTGLITQNNATYSSPGASIIGGRISGGTNSTVNSIASGAVLLLYTLPITTAGVWLINYQASITVTTPSTGVGFVLAGLNTTSNSTAPTLGGSLSRMFIPIITGTPVPTFQLQGSYIYTTSATDTTIYLTSVTTATSIVTAAATSFITATRIA